MLLFFEQPECTNGGTVTGQHSIKILRANDAANRYA